MWRTRDATNSYSGGGGAAAIGGGGKQFNPYEGLVLDPKVRVSGGVVPTRSPPFPARARF